MFRLVLIDGNAILHRAYHALPPLTNQKGEPTHAVYGFIAMLLRVIEDLKPSHLAVTFDRPKPTFRKKMFEAYQAHRPKMEEALSSQVEKVHTVVSAMNIPVYEADGFEADDVIATLTSQVLRVKHDAKSELPSEVVIVTGDRDLLQLVNDKVKLYMPVKGVNEAKLFGEKEAEKRMGVVPALVPDFKALAGDASDNYPGVAGIGPKTAITLLKKFGGIKQIYQKLNQVEKESVREKLVKDKENAFLSFKLAHVIDTAPVQFDPLQTKLTDFLTRETIEVFGELGFKTLLKRLTKMSQRNEEKSNSPIEKKKDDKSKVEEEQMGLF